MATPTKHALCSASSSERWMHCTAAPRFEENFPATTSDYAEEGRTAHAICELYAKYAFGGITKRSLNSSLKKLREDRFFSEEMIQTADVYVQYLKEKAMTFEHPPYIQQEVRVDLSSYIPDGFGTCDCIMIGDDTLHITDYKHGKGVIVSAENNSQMRLYALGAIQQYSMLFSVKNVSMAIVQPRIAETVSEETITVDELLTWGEKAKALAYKAYTGLGEFKAGDWCLFCRGKAQCKARAEKYTALEDFKDFALPKKTIGDKAVPGVLTNADVGDLLTRGAGLKKWYEELQEYALSAILNGENIPGWKAVAGRSNRVFADADKALELLKAAGYDDKTLYTHTAKSLSVLEKTIGVKKFQEILGKQIVKPVGAPTLVVASDKREPYNSAKADFAEVVS